MENIKKQGIWETKQFLIDCARDHPKAQVEDYVKHLYQSEFGGGHMITDEAASLLRLREEIAGLSEKQKKQPWFFHLCGHFCRINLSVSEVLSPEMLHRLFIASACRVPKGARFLFEEKLRLFWEMSREKDSPFPFSSKEVEEYLRGYKESGYQPVQHSEEYHRIYEPAYRVICREYAEYVKLYAAMERCLKERGSVTVAIDGNSAAGKSRLGDILTQIFDCNVFHADDFFLPLEKRTPQRLSETGGNMDRERLREEILEKLRGEQSFSYRPFDCSLMKLSEPVEVQPKKINILEGAYCMHPELREYYDVKVFLSISPGEQSTRILERNGNFMLRRFLEEWIPMENAYFEKMKVREACDFVF